jgi:hypothetical protein
MLNDARLLSDDDLVRVTGKRRYSKQAEWFKNNYGIDAPRAADGRLIVMWETFAALNARKAGLSLGADAPKTAFELCYD